MENKKNISILLTLAVMLSVGLGCQMLKPKAETANSDSNKASANSETTKNSNEATKSNQTPDNNSADQKSDFKLTAKEYYKPRKEWSDAKGEKAKDEKWEAMNAKFPEGTVVEITGKVQFALKESTDKKTPEGMKYHININAGGMFDFILCYIDEADKAEFENVKAGQVITIRANVFFYPSVKNSRLVEKK